MAKTNSESRSIAMLVDGDNAQPALIEHVLAEAAKYGIVTTRRVFGDWTDSHMSGWKESLHSHAVQPMQQFRYTVGKNATDSALIIDAMDLLHSGTVEGFCIVSSDSDYTRLATRIREQGLFVMGIGQSHTPKSFVNACEVFIYTENLFPQPRQAVSEVESIANEKGETTVGEPALNKTPVTEIAASSWTQTVVRAIEITAQENGWAFLGAVGTSLRQLDPAFDSRSYGHKRLSPLIQSMPDLFETKEYGSQNGPSQVYVRLKTTQ